MARVWDALSESIVVAVACEYFIRPWVSVGGEEGLTVSEQLPILAMLCFLRG